MPCALSSTPLNKIYNDWLLWAAEASYVTDTYTSPADMLCSLAQLLPQSLLGAVKAARGLDALKAMELTYRLDETDNLFEIHLGAPDAA